MKKAPAKAETFVMVSLVGASSNTLYGVISDVDVKLAECGLIMVGKKVVNIGNVNHKQHVPYDTKILYSEGKS